MNRYKASFSSSLRASEFISRLPRRAIKFVSESRVNYRSHMYQLTNDEARNGNLQVTQNTLEQADDMPAFGIWA